MRADGGGEFTLGCGPLGLQVSCGSGPLREALTRRYRGFLIPPTEASVAVEVHLTDARRTTDLQERGMVVDAAGMVRFAAPGYEGYVDEVKGRASLAVSSQHPVEDVDYFLRVVVALAAFRDGGLLFHSAGILRGDRALLFYGHSGSGKSTLCRLSPQDRVLNDDLILLLPRVDGWYGFSTPFWNPTQVKPAGATGGPVAALFRLVQARQVAVQPRRRAQILADLVANVPVIPLSGPRTELLVERFQGLLARVPAFDLHFRPDPSFWPAVEAVLPD